MNDILMNIVLFKTVYFQTVERSEKLGLVYQKSSAAITGYE